MWLMKEFSKRGVQVDKIYYCPHSPTDKGNYRKTRIDLILKAGKEFDLDLSKSWMIGNDKTDILAGREANLKTIFLGTQNFKKWRDIRPHYYAFSLIEAVKIITTKSLNSRVRSV